MDYTVPAALAGKPVFPQRQVIAVTGEGGFSMAINGVRTARNEKIPIVTVVLINSALVGSSMARPTGRGLAR